MDKDKVVEITRTIADRIIEENGKLNLFMLIPDIERDTFTLFVSAKWLDNVNAYEGTKKIATYLFNYNDKEYIQNISRVSIAKSTDPGVLSINIMGLSGGICNIVNCRFNNVVLERAIIFESAR